MLGISGATIQQSNGLEEALPNAHVVLWPLDEVVDINVADAYGILESLPGLLLIGGDGGGELLAHDLRAEPAVVLVNAACSSWDEVSPQADTISGLLESLRSGGTYSFT